MEKREIEKSLRYFLVIAVLDIPPWTYIILGNHGLSDISKAFFGGIYFLFPLFVLRKCPFHVLAKWIFIGKKRGNLLAYMKKVYGKTRFILLLGFVFFFVSAFFITMILS